ncbi:hypothetical protein HKD37_09G026280 [Glycine soja]
MTGSKNEILKTLLIPFVKRRDTSALSREKDIIVQLPVQHKDMMSQCKYSGVELHVFSTLPCTDWSSIA